MTPEKDTDLLVQQIIIRNHHIVMLSRIVVFGFPLGHTHLVSGSWPSEQYQIWVLYHLVSFQSNQIVVH